MATVGARDTCHWCNRKATVGLDPVQVWHCCHPFFSKDLCCTPFIPRGLYFPSERGKQEKLSSETTSFQNPKNWPHAGCTSTSMKHPQPCSRAAGTQCGSPAPKAPQNNHVSHCLSQTGTAQFISSQQPTPDGYQMCLETEKGTVTAVSGAAVTADKGRGALVTSQQ